MQNEDEPSKISKDVSVDVSTQMASPELQEAALIVNELVNSLAAEIQHELAQEDRSACSALH